MADKATHAGPTCTHLEYTVNIIGSVRPPPPQRKLLPRMIFAYAVPLVCRSRMQEIKRVRVRACVRFDVTRAPNVNRTPVELLAK